MSHKLINLNPDLKRLRDDGYEIEIVRGYLVVSNVPYVNSQKCIQRGVLVSELTLAGEKTTKPGTHVIYFAGEHPCSKNGIEIAQIKHQSKKNTLAEGIVVNHSFSNKPKGGYMNYYEKITRYIEIISAPARSIDGDVTAQTFKVIEEKEEDSVFNYIDTNSSRADIINVSEKIRYQRIAIVGLGGSGAYVLDYVTKTPVAEIHLYDADKFIQHNAFRTPGAAHIDDLKQQPYKVDYFKSIYSNMRRFITSHPYNINNHNIEELLKYDFVFICVDSGLDKRCIFDALIKSGIPFVDVGMGVEINDDKLTGMLRVTTGTDQKHDHINQDIISFSENDDDVLYRKNIQIAELNALNAAYAVIKWKKIFGFYLDLEHEHHSLYILDGNSNINEFHNA